LLAAAWVGGLAACGGSEEPRSDAQIRHDVVSSLDAANLTTITVSVSNGAVSLSGTAPDQAAVDRAIVLAHAVRGVVAVENRVQVQVSSVPPIANDPASDSFLTGKVRLALQADTSLAGSNIEVSVAGGVATLKGKVPTEQARVAAEKTARATAGIKDVANELAVAAGTPTVPVVPDEQIKVKVEELLDTRYEDLALLASVSNGVVALKGAVPTRNLIVDIADAVHNIPGVTAVDTRLLTVQGGEDVRIGSGDAKPK
jgi:osmotically-inducible protein OsmY